MTDVSLRERSTASIFTYPTFRLLFAATTISRLGTQVSYLAIPLTAVLALNASPGQVGILVVLQTVAFLLIGLPAGAWVDRTRRQPVMVVADVIRGVSLGWVPIAWWLDMLTINQLYAVVLLTGVATVFAEIAAQSYLPLVVGRDRLLSANSTLVGVDAVSMIGGRSVGGFLIQLFGAPSDRSVRCTSVVRQKFA